MNGHPTDMLQSLALGELDVDETRAVMDHADACAECAHELADAMRGVAALASSHAEQPAPQARSAPAARRARWLVGALAAAVIALGIWNIQLQTATSVPIDALVHSHFAHHALAGTGGQAKVIQALDGTWVYVVATGLRPLRAYDVQVNGMKIGSIRAGLSGDATGYWGRPAGKITSAALVGQGSALRWDGR